MSMYDIRIENKTTKEELEFKVKATSGAEAIGLIVTGKQKLRTKVVDEVTGKDKMLLRPFFPNEEWRIISAHKPGVDYPELIGKTV